MVESNWLDLTGLTTSFIKIKTILDGLNLLLKVDRVQLMMVGLVQSGQLRVHLDMEMD